MINKMNLFFFFCFCFSILAKGCSQTVKIFKAVWIFSRPTVTKKTALHNWQWQKEHFQTPLLAIYSKQTFPLQLSSKECPHPMRAPTRSVRSMLSYWYLGWEECCFWLLCLLTKSPSDGDHLCLSILAWGKIWCDCQQPRPSFLINAHETDWRDNNWNHAVVLQLEKKKKKTWSEGAKNIRRRI